MTERGNGGNIESGVRKKRKRGKEEKREKRKGWRGVVEHIVTWAGMY